MGGFPQAHICFKPLPDIPMAQGVCSRNLQGTQQVSLIYQFERTFSLNCSHATFRVYNIHY